MTSKKAVIGLVNTHEQADRIVDALQSAGIPRHEISALFPDKTGSRDFAVEKNTKAPEGAVTGASAGGAIGGTIGLLAGIGALAIPGLGPFIAAGPIMAALSGAAAGAALGGLTGALIGMGIPEMEAKMYEGKVAGGQILLSVHTEDNDQRDRVQAVLERAGASDIVVAGEHSVPSPRQAQGKPAGMI
jgi:outer membrane lipoprotein SlyB